MNLGVVLFIIPSLIGSCCCLKVIPAGSVWMAPVESEQIVSRRTTEKLFRLWPHAHPSISQTVSSRRSSPYHPVVRFANAQKHQRIVHEVPKPLVSASDFIAFLSSSLLGQVSNNRYRGQRFGFSKRDMPEHLF